jgi:type IV fimbrial biogenesis protein FimT
MEKSSGFTLVETLAVLAVASVLLSIGVPSLASLASTSRVSTAASDLLADLLLTRSEAAKRRVRVVMCKSANGETCAATGSWQQGWIVFVDNDGDAQRDAGETLLRVQPALAATMRLTGTQPVAKYVSYVSTGNTKLVGGGFQAGTLTVCSQSADPSTARQIIVNSTGRPRTQKVQLPSCA